MPLTSAQYAAAFAPHPVPALLADLLEFQNGIEEGELYSRAIWLSDREKYGLEVGWSKDPAFLSELFPFAVANAGGSFYALWRHDPTAPIEAWPVVVFGDEGGEWLVARNLAELLAITTIDVEPLVMHDSFFFYKDEDDEDEDYGPSEQADAYLAWLEAHGIAPVADPEPVIEAAQAELQETFDQWKEKFFG